LELATKAPQRNCRFSSMGSGMESETEESAAAAKELPASRRKCAWFTTLRMVKVNPLLGPWTSVLSVFDRTSGRRRHLLRDLFLWTQRGGLRGARIARTTFPLDRASSVAPAKVQNAPLAFRVKKSWIIFASHSPRQAAEWVVCIRFRVALRSVSCRAASVSVVESLRSPAGATPSRPRCT
jgi:hypothetical protein